MPGSGLELVGEHLTEVYHYRPATPKATSHAIVLVPGNPGAVYFYMPFLESLGKSRGGRSSVHGFSFANHHLSRGDAEDDFTNSALGLEQQIAHSAAFIDSVAHELPVNGTITLIGHSIGAYIVLQIISRGPSIMARLAGVIHLMPFFRWSLLPLSHKAKLSLYAQAPSTVNALINVFFQRFKNLPLLTKTRLLQSSTSGAKGEVDVIAGRLLTERLLRNFAAMGLDEIHAVYRNELQLGRQLKLLDGCIPQIILVTDNDEWCPEEEVRVSKATLPHTEVLFVPNLTHSFSLSLHNADLVATLVAKHIAKENSSNPNSRL